MGPSGIPLLLLQTATKKRKANFLVGRGMRPVLLPTFRVEKVEPFGRGFAVHVETRSASAVLVFSLP
jgi:hypothetical protein